ncbi:MAG: transcriptional repressor [Deltaproteobacteria bacterium]|nr:transcriptional repressor [Deltaproteobacteria bacterium]
MSTLNKLDQLYKRLSDKGLKRTRQRDIIFRIFFSPPHKHYRIEELLERCRREDPTISYATVYRTLILLVEAGLAFQRQFGKGQSLFEHVSGHHHDHLICTSCGAIEEFENRTIEKLQESVAKKYGFRLTSHKMELYGLCAKCQKKE